jgi:hypothetical protein
VIGDFLNVIWRWRRRTTKPIWRISKDLDQFVARRAFGRFQDRRLIEDDQSEGLRLEMIDHFIIRNDYFTRIVLTARIDDLDVQLSRLRDCLAGNR